MPTLDRDVQEELRRRGVPAVCDDEGPFARRQRLRALLLKERETPPSQSEGAAAVGKQGTEETEGDGESDEEAEEFATPGSEALLKIRNLIAERSLAAATTRAQSQTHAYAPAEPGTLPRRSNVSKLPDFAENVRVKASLLADSRPLLSVRFSPDSRHLLASSFAPDLRLWSLETHNAPSRNVRDGVTSCSISNVEHEEGRRLAGGHTTRVHAIGWSPSSEHFASGDAIGHIALWRLNELGAGARADDALPEVVAGLVGHEARINRLEFHPLCHHLLASSSHDETWRLWDVETATTIVKRAGVEDPNLLVQEGHGAGVYALAHHPSGALLASSDLDGVVRLWDLRSGRSTAALSDFSVKHSQVLALDFNPQSPNILLSANGAGMINLWDVRTNRIYDKIAAHSAPILQAQFAPLSHFHSQASQASEGLSQASVHVDEDADEGRRDIQTDNANNEKFGEAENAGETFDEEVSETFILSASHDGDLKIWADRSLKCLRVLTGHQGPVMDADIQKVSGAQGSLRGCPAIASAGYDMTLKLWTAM